MLKPVLVLFLQSLFLNDVTHTALQKKYAEYEAREIYILQLVEVRISFSVEFSSITLSAIYTAKKLNMQSIVSSIYFNPDVFAVFESRVTLSEKI